MYKSKLYANMKEKILNALKTKYSNLGLSEKAFDGVAEFYSKTITDESKIEEVVTGAQSMLTVMQGEADRVRGEGQSTKAELEKQINDLNEKLKLKEPEVKPEVKGGTEAENAEIKALQETLKGLVDKQSLADKTRADNLLKAEARSKMIEAGATEKLCDRVLGNIQIGEADTVDTISAKGIEEYNFIKAEITPEAGNPAAQVIVTSESENDAYFAAKKAESESKQKNIENVSERL